MNTRTIKVGFIGLGDQGAPMAEAIAEKEWDLHTWARRAESFGALERVRYTRHGDAKSLAAEVDVLCLCLPDDLDIWNLLVDQDVRRALRPKTVVVNHGTGDPGENERIARFLSELGVEYLDAPVSGGHPGAVARTLTTFVGGDVQVFEFCRPIFETFSRKVAHIGQTGFGQLTKLLNNALTMTNLKNAVDVFAIAQQLGMDTRKLHEVVTVSSGSSEVLKSIGTQINSSAAVHIQRLMLKDMEHFSDAMLERGVEPHELRKRGLDGANGVVGLALAVEGK
ncbi:NAD(P)-dependent oxidoreductase [Paraburkholderia hospita]|uniref:NAD(P)-dependent oxidoreductase n=1 Tax=Paraburkholderia hospita TaxID=169430 RepID=UPI0002719C3B|nr:NAD(P)-dependent oxidoreductase [Paraburkholderia hospita]EUC12402.1 6-phosphogluconate dehydrogenase NAD-binding protein [Burkholderia sp. BT03]SKC52728.1 3-hydroxyisobutyrate dehydrogenase [Paraburkholderia hospita]